MRELPSRIIVLSKRLKQQMKALLELCVCKMLPILKGWNVRKERNQPFFHFCNEPWTCLMNLMRGQGIFCVEGHTTSHMQTAHVGALAALSKNSITESQNIQGLYFFFRDQRRWRLCRFKQMQLIWYNFRQMQRGRGPVNEDSGPICLSNGSLCKQKQSCNLKQTRCIAIRYKYIFIQIGWGHSEEIFNL